MSRRVCDTCGRRRNVASFTEARPGRPFATCRSCRSETEMVRRRGGPRRRGASKLNWRYVQLARVWANEGWTYRAVAEEITRRRRRRVSPRTVRAAVTGTRWADDRAADPFVRRVSPVPDCSARRAMSAEQVRIERSMREADPAAYSVVARARALGVHHAALRAAVLGLTYKDV